MSNTNPYVRPALRWLGAVAVGARGLLLLLACSAALAVHAQEKPPGAQRPTPTPTPTYTPLKRGRINERIEQGVQAQLTAGIYGAIRWKKEYGLPSTDGGRTANKSLNCGAFRVESNVQEGASGTFGRASSAGYYTIQNEPTEENGYYVCRYSFTDRNPLPRDRVITVSAYIGAFADEELNRALRVKPWFGEGGPQPPPGQQRVPLGSRGITLTDDKPRANVDFEMVYRPLPARPR